jgi:hypothetical protein
MGQEGCNPGPANRHRPLTPTETYLPCWWCSQWQDHDDRARDMRESAAVGGSRHVILRRYAVDVDMSVARDTLPFIMGNFLPGQEYHHVKHPHNLIEYPNGSTIYLGGLDDGKRMDKILGSEFATIFLNECSQIAWESARHVRSRLAQVVDGCVQRMFYDLNPVEKSHWTNELFGSKRDPETRQQVSDPKQFARMFMSPEDNARNLGEDYLNELRNESGNYYKRFYKGEYIDEVPGALWSYTLIEACRCSPEQQPQYLQTVVAIDPSGASTPGDKSDIERKPQNDEIGIVVASLGDDQKVYLRADVSVRGGPEQWGKAAIAAYHHFEADHILAEVNFGGGMVEYVIRSIDGGVPVKQVRAAPGQGKHVRAEPVSTLYARGRARHVGKFTELEDQLCAFNSLGYTGSKSPDRADAWIWAVTDLALQGGAAGWIEYYRRLNEAAGVAVPTKPEFGFEITPEKPKAFRVRIPGEITTLLLSDGGTLQVPPDRIVEVPEFDAIAYGMRGWERLGI